MEIPTYYSILTADVRYSKNISDFEKLLYSDITCLTNKRGVCTASNNYFAEAFDKSPKTISRGVSNLEKEGFIATRLIYKKGTKEVEFREIYLSSNVSIPMDKNVHTPLDKNVHTPMDKNAEDNNTSNNNTSNNNKKETKKVSYVLPESVDVELFSDYLALRKTLKAPNTQRAINGLINKLNDFEAKGFNANDIVSTAYENGWKSFYEPKPQFNKHTNNTNVDFALQHNVFDIIESIPDEQSHQGVING